MKLPEGRWLVCDRCGYRVFGHLRRCPVCPHITPWWRRAGRMRPER